MIANGKWKLNTELKHDKENSTENMSPTQPPNDKIEISLSYNYYYD